MLRQSPITVGHRSSMLLTLFHIVNFYARVSGNAVELNDMNVEGYIQRQPYMVLNFYVEWCRYCVLFEPEYNSGATLVHSKHTDAIMAKINCEVNRITCQKYSITKYPTLKVFRFGESRKEYHGLRTADALVKYVDGDLRTEPILISTPEEREKMDKSKNYLFAHLPSKSSEEYRHFSAVAMKLVDDCNSYVTLSTTEAPSVSFFYSIEEESPISFTGSLTAPEWETWAFEYCRPRIPEITFKNAEELTNDGLPLLISFYNHISDESRTLFKTAVEAHDNLLRGKYKPVYAKASVFEPALRRMNKKLTDVPILAVDDFHHLYDCPDYSKIGEPGYFQKFLEDVEVKREQVKLRIQRIIFGGFQIQFGDIHAAAPHKHEEKMENVRPHHQIHDEHPAHGEALPQLDEDQGIKSVFKNLAPNEGRYTMARERDEL